MPPTDENRRRYRLLEAVRDAAFDGGCATIYVFKGNAGMAGLHAQCAAHAVFEKFPVWRSLR